MQNHDNPASGPIKSKLLQWSGGRRWLNALAALLSGYVMSNSFLLSGISPFGVSLCAVLDGQYTYFAALGSVCGYLFSSGRVGNAKYIGAVLLVSMLRWVTGARLRKKFTVAAATLSAGLGMFGAGLMFGTLTGLSLYNALLLLAEVILCSTAAYFFSRSISVGSAGLSGATRSDISCVIISFAIVAMGLAPVSIGGLSVGRMLCVLVILFYARFSGEAGGAIAGITAGIAMGLAGGDYAYLLFAYAFGGLLAGVFSHTSRLGAAVALVIANAFSALFIGPTSGLYTSIFEVFVVSVIFIAIPPSVSSRLRMPFIAQGVAEAEPTQRALSRRLNRVSLALKDIGDTTHRVNEKLGQLSSSAPGQLQTLAAERVCLRCGTRSACWELRPAETMSALADCVRELQKHGALNRDLLPPYLSRVCCKPEALIAELNVQFQQQMSRQGVQLKVAQVRSVVTDQFHSTGLMLEELAREFEDINLLEAGRIYRVNEYLKKQGLNIPTPLCYTDRLDRVHIELALPAWQLARLDKARLTQDLSDLLEVALEQPQVISHKKQTCLTFSEKAAYTLECGAFQIPCKKNRLCGDVYEYLPGQGGRAHLILSDGMGSGGAAAVDATMTTGLFSRLLSVGIEHEAALKMVNSALLIKSGDEALATVDICTVDLFSGKADFYKAGAAPSYLLQGGRATHIQAASLPAGILRGISFEKSRLSLRASDTVVMVSDGVIMSGSDWVYSELEALQKADPDELCRRLAETAHMRADGGRQDDITVAALRLQKGL